MRYCPLLLLLACGGQPRPAELISLELRRQAPNADRLRAGYPKLIETSDAAYTKAARAWGRRQLEDVTHYTRLASIAWRTAEAREATRRQAAELAATRHSDALARASLSARQLRLAQLTQEIAREERADLRREARKALRRIRKALPNRHTEDGEFVDDTLAVLQAADAAGAGEHALDTLLAADEAWRRAIESLRERSYGDAQAFADTARLRANDARRQTAERHAELAPRREENEVFYRMHQAAAGLPGAEPRFDPRGLSIALRHLFSASAGGNLRADRETTVAAIAAIAAGNTQFKILVEGHTAGGEANAVLLSRSATQAELVAGRLVKGGVDRARLTVSGRSATRRLGSDYTSAGRALNNRVEVVFLSAFAKGKD